MTPEELVANLKDKWRSYMLALIAVRDAKQRTAAVVVDELAKDPRCKPLIEALSLMMDEPGAERGIPILLDLIVRMAPEINEARDALLFAKKGLGPHLLRYFDDAAQENDDFSLRELAYVARRSRDEELMRKTMERLTSVLSNSSDEYMREVAAYALERFDPRWATGALEAMTSAASADSSEAVRMTAAHTLREWEYAAAGPVKPT